MNNKELLIFFKRILVGILCFIGILTIGVITLAIKKVNLNVSEIDLIKHLYFLAIENYALVRFFIYTLDK